MIYRVIYRQISGDLSADILNIDHFLLQMILRTIFTYRIGNMQKKRNRTISRPTRPIFKTGGETCLIYFVVEFRSCTRSRFTSSLHNYTSYPDFQKNAILSTLMLQCITTRFLARDNARAKNYQNVINVN